ncbi:MAG: mannose-6-phosphate isomerase, partial [Alistipes sp.]|nr:mannose-6-phosphate isomerase [Alistipes sp.]
MEPLKFHPQLRETLWGGERIGSFKRGVETSSDRIGESWEISGLRGCESIVAGGAFDGQSLREVIRQEGANLVGRAKWSRFGEEFPLLIKFIDARLDLSV